MPNSRNIASNMTPITRLRPSLFALLSLLLISAFGRAQQPQTDWPTYGGDPGGMRYTTSRQITPANVTQLQTAWTFHTGALTRELSAKHLLTFEDTPILYRNTLYVATPHDEIIALNPATGQQLWKFDAHLKLDPANVATARGVAAWPLDPRTVVSSAVCSTRIFIGTLDRRLLAVDAATGAPCTDFGDHGSVDLSKDVYFVPGDRYGVTSAPAVIGDVVVVGSLVPDNIRVDIESGLVRAFDVHTGRKVWNWEPLPWAQQQKLRTGAGNAWSSFAVDPEHNLIFVPTGAPSPDFYGGQRPGDNRDANSVVALEATTGRRVWGFQTTHHDVWDYDIAAEPLLFTFRGKIPAVAISTKQGMVFVLNRLTGEPRLPVEERPVPASKVPGEQLSPTQPFQQIDSLSPLTFSMDQPLGTSPQDDADCRKQISPLRYEGIYTPPSVEGTLTYPGNLGGVDWGSASFDPSTGILYANTNHYAFSLKLDKYPPDWQQPLYIHLLAHPNRMIVLATVIIIVVILTVAWKRSRSTNPGAGVLILCAAVLLCAMLGIRHNHRSAESQVRLGEHFGREFGPQTGSDYSVIRMPLVAPGTGHPCMPQPWGTVSALNLNTGKAVWQTPLGTLVPGMQTGTVNLGGDVVTASGLLFTGASEDPYLRAFDSATGRELWRAQLPAPAQATPMSYTFAGRQYVVIAAGGHDLFGTPTADTLVAFALPQDTAATQH